MKKTALITGGARGIGAACAIGLAEDGFRVIVGYNNSDEEAGYIAERIGGMSVKADVSDTASVRRMFDMIGHVDLLVCCAGVAHYGLFTDVTDSEWQHVFDVNIGGVIKCCRAAIPGMINEKSGRIILISSIWGICGASCEAVYSASKAAVIGLTKALAKELGPSGILINCVAPGVIDTDMLTSLTEETIKSLCTDTPLGRTGTPEDVAGVVRFLASDAAAFVTGQVISPNGGIVT